MVEILTSLFGLIQGGLIMLNKKENWIFYMLNIVFLTFYSFHLRLYGDVLENSVYILLGLLGLFTWYNKTVEKKILGVNNKGICYCTFKERVLFIILFFIVSYLCYFWLKYTNDPLPFLDSITTGMGLVATILMALKKIDAWVVWFIDDILMAVIYFSLPDKALYLMALNIVWVFMALFSYLNWRRVYLNSLKIGV